MAAGERETIGREAELGRVDAVLDSLAGGTPAFLAIEGEPGIGKTRVLAELRTRAEKRGMAVLAGATAEFERDMPFGVWVDALDAYVASQAADIAEDGGSDLLAELAGILPAAAAATATAGAKPDAGLADERYRTHRSVQHLLERLAADNALVVVLDDLHWSDTASLELVAALLKRAPEAPVLIAVAFRSGQAPERLTAALAAQSVDRMELGQLSEDEAAQLLAGVDSRSRGAIYRHGGGNPFYLEALARASEEGRLGAALESEPAASGGVPAAVAASLAEELGALAAPARAFINGAAVAGEPFDPDLAGAIAELARDDGLDALDDLLEADLVRSTDVPRRFAFRHPLVRQAVYESTRGGWRLGAHARAAATLQEQGAPAAERAHHVEHSAGQGDEPAIAVLIEAGHAASARAPAAATRWFEAALRLLPASDTARQSELRRALASSLRSLGELERCRDLLLETIALLPESDSAGRVELTTQCAAVEHWLGRHDDAHQRLMSAWENLPDRDTAAAAALQVELAADGLHEFDFAQALAMGNEALERARRLGDAPLIAAAASALALGEAVEGRISDARSHRDEADATIAGLGDQELAPRLEALYYLAWAENYLELYPESVAHVERGLQIARANGEGRLLVPLMLTKCYPFELQGRLAEAMEVCEGAVEAARLSGNPHYIFWSLFELGWAHYYRGDLTAVVAACEESERVGGRLAGGAMPAAGGGPGWPLAAARFELGQIEQGFAVMARMGSDELEHAIPVERCFYWESLTLAELARDRPDAAEAYARRSEEHAAGLDLRVPAAAASRARAAILLAADEPLEAAAAARQAAADCAAVGADLQGAFATNLLGQALVATDDRPAAIEALRDAERVFDSCGAVRVRDEVRRHLRKLGARAEKRGPATGEEAGVGALTKREAGIAELVTDRKTNKEIAAELFLSEKTIESHLRNIFVKLGVSSRVEVARAVERARQ